MRRIRFINQNLSKRFTWHALCYFRPKPPPSYIGVDFFDFKMESATDFGTEAEAKADQEQVERKLGIKID